MQNIPPSLEREVLLCTETKFASERGYPDVRLHLTNHNSTKKLHHNYSHNKFHQSGTAIVMLLYKLPACYVTLLLYLSALCLHEATGGPVEPSQPLSSASESGPPQTYGVIVDCGSSGTRVHIYQWDTELTYPNLLQDIEPMRDPVTNETVSKKFTPGLSKLADSSTEDIHAYIKPVADYIAEKVPESRHQFTVVYLMATAGMRLLDEKSQERIMTVAKNYIGAWWRIAENRSHYNFRDVTTSVISGSQEGMYSWISVNSRTKRFLHPESDQQTKTYGIMEMGGASVQVAYQLAPGVKELILSVMSSDHLKKIYEAQVIVPQISRNHSEESRYELHSTTFLGFGGDSARDAFLDLLIKKHNVKSHASLWFRSISRWFKRPEPMMVVYDPCSPSGYKSELKKPSRMLVSTTKTIGFTIEDADENTEGGLFSFRVKGVGNYAKCKRLVEELLWTAKEEKLNCKPDELCPMELLGEYFVPYLGIDYIGIGDFYYTTNTMLEQDGNYKRDEIRDQTKKICQTPMSELEKTYFDIANSDSPKVRERIHSECFRAVWVDTLLRKGFRMPEDASFMTRSEVYGEEPDWTLGAVLDKSLAIDEKTEGEQPFELGNLG
jgi:Golgi nucleoside diphosphatase